MWHPVLHTNTRPSTTVSMTPSSTHKQKAQYNCQYDTQFYTQTQGPVQLSVWHPVNNVNASLRSMESTAVQTCNQVRCEGIAAAPISRIYAPRRLYLRMHVILRCSPQLVSTDVPCDMYHKTRMSEPSNFTEIYWKTLGMKDTKKRRYALPIVRALQFSTDSLYLIFVEFVTASVV